MSYSEMSRLRAARGAGTLVAGVMVVLAATTAAVGYRAVASAPPTAAARPSEPGRKYGSTASGATRMK